MRKFKKYFVQQHDEKDCGSACLLSIAKYYGRDYNLEYLKEISGTTSKGTTFLGLIQASTKIGLEATAYQAGIQDLGDVAEPFILHVEVNQHIQHYVVCLGRLDEKYVIMDPAFGTSLYTQQELLDIWKKGYVLIIKKTPDFKSSRTKSSPHLRWLLGVMNEDSSFYISAVFLGVLIALLNMATLVFIEKLIDVILPSKDIFLLFKSFIIWGLLLVTVILIVYVRSLILVKQAYRFNTRVVHFFFKKLLVMPKVFFDSKKQGDMISRMNDTERLQENIKTIIADSLIECFVIIISLVFLSFYSLQAATIVLLAAPVLLACAFLYNEKIKKTQHLMFGNRALTESNYIDTISGIETIKSFSREAFFTEKNKTIYVKFQDALLQLFKKSISQNLMIELSGTLLGVSAVIFALLQVVENTIQVGDLIAIISLSTIAIEAIKNVVQLNFDIIESKVATERMFDFVERSDEKESFRQVSKKLIPEKIDSLSMKDLSFSYPGQASLIDQGDLIARRGEITFLKGPSGKGKSTLAQLFLKFYEPSSGEILLNDTISLQVINQSLWRKTIAYLPQDIKIFNGSLSFNIALDDTIKKEEVIEFCRKWNIFDSFFTRFYESYETLLGEEGVHPSGGEKQIIGVARALFKEPKILILDEPTSSLDKEAQDQLMSLFETLKQDMIILFITHKTEDIAGKGPTYVLQNKAITIFK